MDTRVGFDAVDEVDGQILPTGRERAASVAMPTQRRPRSWSSACSRAIERRVQFRRLLTRLRIGISSMPARILCTGMDYDRRAARREFGRELIPAESAALRQPFAVETLAADDRHNRYSCWKTT